MPFIAPTPSIITYPAGGSTGGYQIIVVGYDGARVALGELINAEGDKCSWRLNAAGTATFSIPTLDSRASTIQGLAREVQIWRHGRLLWWGPIVRPEASAKRVTVQCRSLEWYFDRLFFGRADRANLLTNPSFETGDTTGWTAFNSTPVATQSLFIEGAWSVRLEQITAGQEAYIEQVLDDYGATGVGSVLTLAGWYYIPADTWDGPAIESKGVTIERRESASSTQLEIATHFIDDATPRGSWQRFELLVHMPPDAVEDIVIRLWNPADVIHFDALSLTLMESISSVSSATDFTSDLADLFTLIVQHAQDTSFGKDDKNIDVNAALTGIRVERHYQFAEHPNIGGALRQFTDEGLCDWSVEITPTTRTATLYAPTKGSHKPQFRIYLYGNATEGTTKANVADDLRFSFDGEQGANSIVVLGPGDGPDREEGGAVDNSVFSGHIYEEVVSSPPEATINSLDNQANEFLDAFKTPEILRVTYLPMIRPGDTGYDVTRDPIDSLHVGDTVPVEIDYGWLQVDANFRIIAKEVDMKRDLATYDLNRVT